jgi:hypothetical protein
MEELGSLRSPLAVERLHTAVAEVHRSPEEAAHIPVEEEDILGAVVDRSPEVVGVGRNLAAGEEDSLVAADSLVEEAGRSLAAEEDNLVVVGSLEEVVTRSLEEEEVGRRAAVVGVGSPAEEGSPLDWVVDSLAFAEVADSNLVAEEVIAGKEYLVG